MFDGDENAIVDFKYSPDPRLDLVVRPPPERLPSTPEDEEHFRRDTSGKKMYDPDFRSCTKFIATVAREKFGYDAPDLAELVKWADIIDGAQYADAKTAVELAAPAMKLTLVIEGVKGSAHGGEGDSPGCAGRRWPTSWRSRNPGASTRRCMSGT